MDGASNTLGVHAPGSVEHSLCGFAPEAYESGDSDEPIVFAAPGDQVTCEACRHQIDWVRQNFKRYRYNPTSEDTK